MESADKAAAADSKTGESRDGGRVSKRKNSCRKEKHGKMGNTVKKEKHSKKKGLRQKCAWQF